MIDLTQIFQAIIMLIAALISTRLIPWLKINATEKQRALLEGAVRTAVFAAEQLYGAGHGQEKLEDAANYLRSHGYEVDIGEIEAAVYTYMQKYTAPVETVEPEEIEEDPEI